MTNEGLRDMARILAYSIDKRTEAEAEKAQALNRIAEAMEVRNNLS